MKIKSQRDFWSGLMFLVIGIGFAWGATNYNFGSYETLDKIYQQRASYVDIFSDYDSLPAAEQTPAALARLVNENTSFAITDAEAARVLETEDNEYFVEGHGYLGAKTFPKVNEYKEFFVYGSEVRHNLLGSVVGKQQNAVWATGTHTNTPVPVVAWGPESVTATRTTASRGAAPVTSTRPPRGVYLTALSMRLIRTWRRQRWSAIARGVGSVGVMARVISRAAASGRTSSTASLMT